MGEEVEELGGERRGSPKLRDFAKTFDAGLYSEQYIDAMTESLGNDFSGQSLRGIFARFSLTPDVEEQSSGYVKSVII